MLEDDRYGRANLLAHASWQVKGFPTGEVDHPENLVRGIGWTAAEVPGRLTGAQFRAHLPANRVAYEEYDWWWTAEVNLGPEPAALHLDLEGVATCSEVWVNDELVLETSNMFRRYTATLGERSGSLRLDLRVVGLSSSVLPVANRPRWKSHLTAQQDLRFFRTSLIGRTHPQVEAPIIGPWRPVVLYKSNQLHILDYRLHTSVDGSVGVVTADLRLNCEPKLPFDLVVLEYASTFTQQTEGNWRAQVRVPKPDLWWPHTHGDQPLYEVKIRSEELSSQVVRVGFRTVKVLVGGGRFRLLVNDTEIFCRGASWSPIFEEAFSPESDVLLSALKGFASCGMNLIRVPATTIYESDNFYESCDVLGILVWQDCMLVDFDYPETESFRENILEELSQFFGRVSGRACIAVVSGGSETEQRPAMLGLPPDRRFSSLQRDIIPRILSRCGLEVPYVPFTPFGSDFPVHTRNGVSHYFGIGAYRRPLSDVYSADIAFAAECLAFSIPPEASSVDRHFSSSRVAGHHPGWKRGVPRDHQASWDFEDVRDYYVRELFEVDPVSVRWEDSQLYLDLGRAAICIAMVSTFTHWRRESSRCSGAILLSWRDSIPGAGMGLIDSDGLPKPPLYAVTEVLLPISLLICDDGFDGLTFVVVNDSPRTLRGKLTVQCWSTDGDLLFSQSTSLRVNACATMELSLDAMLRVFTDTAHAFRFGPRSRDVLEARIVDDGGSILVERTVLLGDHLRPRSRGGMTGTLQRDERDWYLDLHAERTAQWVAISCPGFTPDNSWFHMRPGAHRRVRLIRADGPSRPSGLTVRALNIEEFAVTAP